MGSDRDMKGRIVLVAGGTGALGRAVSLLFLARGARVTVTTRRMADVSPLREAAGSDAARLTAAIVDLTDDKQVQTTIRDLVAREGRLDALVNAAGGYAGGKELWTTDPGILDHMLALNLTPGFLLARAAVPFMLEASRGAIVNVAAQAGLGGAPGAAAYAASKAAALMLFASLAAEVKGSGVTVNSVVPSIFDTSSNRKAMPDADHSRWPRPEEIAEVIFFLCSDAARAIHGAAIPVGGNR